MILKTIDDELRIKSSLRRETMNGLIIVTQYLRNLSMFIKTYEQSPLIKILEESMKSSWFTDVPDILPQSIDDIVVEDLLKESWTKKW